MKFRIWDRVHQHQKDNRIWHRKEQDQSLNPERGAEISHLIRQIVKNTPCRKDDGLE